MTNQIDPSALSDRQIIAAFMDPAGLTDPELHSHPTRRWWERDATPWPLTLEALLEVQARLSDGQWQQYLANLGSGLWLLRQVAEATAEQKAAALAPVLRETVAALIAERAASGTWPPLNWL